MAERLRVVFVGSDCPFSQCMVQAIAKAHTVIGIIEGTKDQHLKGFASAQISYLRWRYWGGVSLQHTAEQLNVPYFLASRDTRRKIIPFLQLLRPDIGCVTIYPWLIPAEALTVPKYGFINCHPSLLPNYRGADPFFWQFYTMERLGGVTIHQIDEGEDTGDIICQQSFPIELGWELAQFRTVITRVSQELMVSALNQISAGTAERVPQRHLPSPVHARSVRPDEPLVNWVEWPIERVWHLLRGTAEVLHALPPANGLLPGYDWKVLDYTRCRCTEAAGEIHLDAQGFYAAHPEGKIRLRRVWSFRRFLRAEHRPKFTMLPHMTK